MAVYCTAGDKPTIKYQFSGQNQKIFKSNFAPLDVQTKTTPVEGSINFNNEGYQITFYSPNNFKFVSYLVKDWRIINKGYLEFNFIACDKTTFNNSGPTIDPNQVSFDFTKKCLSSDSSPKRCSILVYYENLLIFQDQGNCPVNFDVQCGNCPPGSEEMKSTVYPGYCCLDCTSVANSIRDLKNLVRGLNG